MCVALLLSACSGTRSPASSAPTKDNAASATSSPPTTSNPSTAASPSASADPTPTTVMGKRCGQPDVPSSTQLVAGPGGARLALSQVGTGDTVALLLHETAEVASCGWWPFATRLAAAGVRVEMLDFCSYGASTCSGSFTDDYVAQVAAAVTHLRSSGAVRRLVLVGASLGGTVAVNSATPVRADAVVDLSGFGFGPLVTAGPIAALRMPLLAAGSPDDNPDSDRLAAEVTASGTAVKRFVPAPAGHGWSMVLDGPFADSATSDLGRTVIAWVKGDTGS